ncbi:MAG: LPS-assembly protein LptD [Rhodomicrobiaceae bacterium]
MGFEALHGGRKPYGVAAMTSRLALALQPLGRPPSILAFAVIALAGALLSAAPAEAAKSDLLKSAQQNTKDLLKSPQTTKNETNLPLLLQADELVDDKQNDRIIAKGNVEVYYKNYALLADSLIYDQRAKTLNAVGNVRIKEPDGALINADRITLTDDFRDGFIRSFQSVTKEKARIAAESAYRKDGNTTVFEHGVFTPCRPCADNPDAPPIWRIKANRIIDKKDEGNVYFEDGVFEAFGVPLIWLPYFYYPDPTVKRRSGFLAPEFGHSNDLGFTVGVPYYYSFSPSADLTVKPVVTTNAGFLLESEWRQRLSTGSYRIDAAGVYDDSPPGGESSKFRGSVQTQGEFNLGSWWKWGWDITAESDDTFRRFYKLDDIYATDRISTIYLVGQSDRNYFSANLYHFGGLTATDSSQVNSDVHPAIDYNYIFDHPVIGGELSFDTSLLSLSRDNGADVNRIVNQVKWRRSFTDSIGEIVTPFAQARADVYHTTSFNDPISSPVAEEATTAFRGSALAGLEYRYPFVKHTEDATHVIEPIAQIIARPSIKDQGDIPNEDARSLVFDDTLLFDIDKFSGYDRIETGTRANVGVQYSIAANRGWNARFVAGQSYQLAGENPFGEGSGLSNSKSDYVAGAYLDLSNNLQLVSQVRMDEHDLEVKRHDLGMTAAYGPFTGSANYVNAKADPSQGFDTNRQEVAGVAAIKLADRWTLFGDMRYDIDGDQVIRDSIGLKYSDECFMLSVSYIDTNVTDGDIKPSQTVLVRYDLLTLGGTSSRTDSIGTASELPVIK